MQGLVPGQYKAGAANFLFEVFEVPGVGGGGVDNCGLGEYLASEAHGKERHALLTSCCDPTLVRCFHTLHGNILLFLSPPCFAACGHHLPLDGGGGGGGGWLSLCLLETATHVFCGKLLDISVR